ncbi:MAG: hypothetical protein JJT90_00720 [Ectothiorhodospiraceae bacterium]|nr:hypothetical protein [Ectothiorhodospiraceae bacterium]
MDPYRILLHWLAVCRLRAGPQDQAYSVNLLVIALALNTGLSVVFLGQAQGPGSPPAQALLGTAVALCFCYLVLRAWGLANRFVQTTTTLFGTNALLTAAALPPALALAGAAPEQAPAWAALWLLGVAVWTVAVTGHIFRHALDTSMLAGLGVAILLFITSMLTGSLLH